MAAKGGARAGQKIMTHRSPSSALRASPCRSPSRPRPRPRPVVLLLARDAEGLLRCNEQCRRAWPTTLRSGTSSGRRAADAEFVVRQWVGGLRLLHGDASRDPLGRVEASCWMGDFIRHSRCQDHTRRRGASAGGRAGSPLCVSASQVAYPPGAASASSRGKEAMDSPLESGRR